MTNIVDVSASYEKLQADKHATDKVVREFTALETLDDIHALKDYFETVHLKAEVCQLQKRLGHEWLTCSCKDIARRNQAPEWQAES